MDWPSRDADLHEVSLAEWGQWDRSLGKPTDYTEDLLAAYVTRKRWEYREQAIAHFAVYAEMTGEGQPANNTPPPRIEQGVNYMPPPFRALAKVGFMTPM